MKVQLLSVILFLALSFGLKATEDASSKQNLNTLLEKNEKNFSLAKKFIDLEPQKAIVYLQKIHIDHPEMADSTSRQILFQKIELLEKIDSLDLVDFEFEQAIEIFNKRSDSLGLAETYERQADWLLNKSNFELAMNSVIKARDFYARQKNQDKVGELLLKKGAIEYARGDYINSIETIFDAADQFKESGSKYHLAFSYLQIGITYLFIEQYEKSLSNYSMARDEFLSFNDSLGAAMCNSNIALVYLELGQYDTALTILKESTPTIQKSDRKIAISQAWHNTGLSFAGLSQIDSALYYYRKSLKLDKKISYTIGASSNYLQIGQVYNSMGQIDSVLYYGKKALESLKKAPDIDIESEANLLMALTHYNLGDYEQSSHFFKAHTMSLDSINRESEILDRIAYNQGDKIEKYRNELMLAKQREEIIAEENRGQRNLIYGLAIIGILLIVVLIQVLIINRRNKKLNQTLSANQKIIESDLAIKKALLNEIHHRVKNNLQVISSMLSIQTQYISDPKLTEIMEESKARINSMALIHESLYRRDANDITSFNSYIKDLIPRLINTYQVDEQKVQLIMDLEDIELSIDESVPCGLLINELISNSLKHAFPNDLSGKITISMKKEEDGEIVLGVKDNGVGLPDTVIPQNQDTFGFLLIYTLVAQLEADLKVEAKKGLEFTIRWKSKDYAMLE